MVRLGGAFVQQLTLTPWLVDLLLDLTFAVGLLLAGRLREDVLPRWIVDFLMPLPHRLVFITLAFAVGCFLEGRLHHFFCSLLSLLCRNILFECFQIIAAHFRALRDRFLIVRVRLLEGTVNNKMTYLIIVDIADIGAHVVVPGPALKFFSTRTYAHLLCISGKVCDDCVSHGVH